MDAASPVQQGRRHARRSFSHRAVLPADAAAVPRASLSSRKLTRVPDATAAAAAAADDAVAAAVARAVSAGWERSRIKIATPAAAHEIMCAQHF